MVIIVHNIFNSMTQVLWTRSPKSYLCRSQSRALSVRNISNYPLLCCGQTGYIYQVRQVFLPNPVRITNLSLVSTTLLRETFGTTTFVIAMVSNLLIILFSKAFSKEEFSRAQEVTTSLCIIASI